MVPFPPRYFRPNGHGNPAIATHGCWYGGRLWTLSDDEPSQPEKKSLALCGSPSTRMQWNDGSAHRLARSGSQPLGPSFECLAPLSVVCGSIVDRHETRQRVIEHPFYNVGSNAHVV